MNERHQQDDNERTPNEATSTARSHPVHDLVSPHWIERVSWDESKVYVNLSREAIKQSPEYTEESLLTRDYETDLHRHYNRAGYWSAGLTVTEHSVE